MDAVGAQPELLSISISNYKNLERVKLPWNQVNVLFGPNGSGKTNLLECLTLLFGTDRSLDLIRDRAVLPAGGQLQCLVTTAARHLPYPPDFALKIGQLASLAERAGTDLAWWADLGTGSGMTIAQAFIDAGLPGALVESLDDYSQRPTIRYELTSMGDFSESSRLFTRTWMAPVVSDRVVELADELPRAFDPLRQWIKRGRQGPAELLVLPPTHVAPARVEWLARPRSSAEIQADLELTFESALPAVRDLAEQMTSMLTSSNEPDPIWWLHEVAANAANSEFRMTQPALEVHSVGDGIASWMVTDATRDAGTSLDNDFLRSLSSGQVRWAEEGLATLARSLADHGRRCAWQSVVWSQAELDGLDEAYGDLSTEVMSLVERDGWVSAEALTRIALLFETRLSQAARGMLDHGPLGSEVMIDVWPALAHVEQVPLTIRVFDEPEAHLHPAAQRHIRDALTTMGRSGDNLVLATHSPYLLSHPDWSYSKVVDGSVRPLRSEDLRASAALAREMGLTTGELLVNTRLVLVVEGKHDRAFLQALYGDQLRDADVVLIPLHGTDNAKALTDAEFWMSFSSVPIAVMFDNARLDRVGDRSIHKSGLTDEEKAFRYLEGDLKRLKRPWRRVGLDRPDITAYLDEAALASRYSRFPGWEAVIAEFSRRRGPGFKSVLADFGVDLQPTPKVEELARTMQRTGVRPPRELELKIRELLAWATSQPGGPQL